MRRHRKHGREKGHTVFNPRRKKQPGMVEKDSMTGAEEKNAPARQEKVLFLGNRSDVDRLYQAMDVFVLPSRYEGLPVVGVEAQAAGLPCVMSDRITESTFILDSTVFNDLEASPEKWISDMYGVVNKYPRRNTVAEMGEAGFDILTETGNLEKLYIGLLK